MGVATTAVVAVLALASARVAIRAQYVIMAAIALSLSRFALGKPLEGTTVEMWGLPREPVGALLGGVRRLLPRGDGHHGRA